MPKKPTAALRPARRLSGEVQLPAHPDIAYWPAWPNPSLPEDAGGLLVIASRPDVGVGEFGALDWITPAGLLRALGMDGFGLDQAIGCLVSGDSPRSTMADRYARTISFASPCGVSSKVVTAGAMLQDNCSEESG